VPFKIIEERESFVRRFEAVCKILNPAGAPAIDNHGVMSAMLDVVECSVQSSSPRDSREQAPSFLRSNGEE
jgi:hypothetical protein